MACNFVEHLAFKILETKGILYKVAVPIVIDNLCSCVSEQNMCVVPTKKMETYLPCAFSSTEKKKS